jgi:hypothetical protein
MYAFEVAARFCPKQRLSWLTHCLALNLSKNKIYVDFLIPGPREKNCDLDSYEADSFLQCECGWVCVIAC